jgi:hypothetical protein
MQAHALLAPALLLRPNPGLFPKLLCLAPAEKLECGFDAFGFADFCMGEKLVDL